MQFFGGVPGPEPMQPRPYQPFLNPLPGYEMTGSGPGMPDDITRLLENAMNERYNQSVAQIPEAPGDDPYVRGPFLNPIGSYGAAPPMPSGRGLEGDEFTLNFLRSLRNKYPQPTVPQQFPVPNVGVEKAYNQPQGPDPAYDPDRAKWFIENVIMRPRADERPAMIRSPGEIQTGLQAGPLERQHVQPAVGPLMNALSAGMPDRGPSYVDDQSRSPQQLPVGQPRLPFRRQYDQEMYLRGEGPTPGDVQAPSPRTPTVAYRQDGTPYNLDPRDTQAITPELLALAKGPGVIPRRGLAEDTGYYRDGDPMTVQRTGPAGAALSVNFPYGGPPDISDPGPQSGLAALDQRLAENDRVKAMLAGRLANSPGQAADVSSVSGQAAGYGTGFNRQPEPARVSESARTLGRGDVQGDRNERSRRVAAAGGWGPGPSGEQPNQVNPLMKEDKDALLARLNKLNPVMNGTTPDYLNDRLRRSEPGAASQYMEQAQALSALEGKMNEQERQKLIADLRGDTTIRPAGASPTGRDEAKFQEYKDNYYRNRNEAQGRTATFNVMRNLQRRGLPPSQALVIAANMFPSTGDVGVSPNYQPTIQGNLSDLAKQAGENMLDPQARQRKFDAEQKDKDREHGMAVATLQANTRADNEAKDADAKLYRDLVVQEERLNEQIANPATPAGELEVLKRSRDENRAAQNAVRGRFSGQKPAPTPAPGQPAPTQPDTFNPNRPISQQSPQYNTATNLRNAKNIMQLTPEDEKTLDGLYSTAPEVSNWLPDSLVSWSDSDYDKVASHIAAGLGDDTLKPKVIEWLKKKK
jgi:hypothetical protein